MGFTQWGKKGAAKQTPVQVCIHLPCKYLKIFQLLKHLFCPGHKTRWRQSSKGLLHPSYSICNGMCPDFTSFDPCKMPGLMQLWTCCPEEGAAPGAGCPGVLALSPSSGLRAELSLVWLALCSPPYSSCNSCKAEPWASFPPGSGWSRAVRMLPWSLSRRAGLQCHWKTQQDEEKQLLSLDPLVLEQVGTSQGERLSLGKCYFVCGLCNLMRQHGGCMEWELSQQSCWFTVACNFGRDIFHGNSDFKKYFGGAEKGISNKS